MKELCYSIVLYVDRSRKYTFYLEIEFFCNEIQNLANYGWFLENLGKMADSKNRWRNWVMLLLFASIGTQYTTFIEISQFFCRMSNTGWFWLIFRIFGILKISQRQPIFDIHEIRLRYLNKSRILCVYWCKN